MACNCAPYWVVVSSNSGLLSGESARHSTAQHAATSSPDPEREGQEDDATSPPEEREGMGQAQHLLRERTAAK
jgi:hypothetical protein